MSFDQTFVSEAPARYMDGLLEPPFAVMLDIEATARREGQPAVGRHTGALLRTLVALHRPKRLLEIGTNIGYSALWMASAMRADAHLDTIEFDEALVARARANFVAATADGDLADRIAIHAGAALDVLPLLDAGAYDLVFLDADKREYPRYFDHVKRLLRPGGVILVDNVFWSGKVWDDSAQDADTRGIRDLTQAAFDDPELTTTIVPVEDGLGLFVKAY